MGHLRRIADIQPFAELAQGSATVVYKGYQASLQRFVLLKVLRPPLAYDEAMVARFAQEARLAAQIQHPNVVAIYTHGLDGDHSYLAAEFIDGTDVRSLLAEHGPLPVDLALFVLLEAAKGLRAAHQKDVLHRDLKPANILVSHEGQVKLTDFGLASLREERDAEIRGTWGYLAPEVVRGDAPTEAADLFALGATWFEMLTARPAFHGETSSAVLDAMLHHDPLPQLERWVSLPDAFKACLARLLAKNPADRHATADALIQALTKLRTTFGLTTSSDDLKTYLADPKAYAPPPLVAAPPPTADRAPAPPMPAARRHPVYYVAGVFLLFVALGTGFMVLNGGLAQAPDSLASPPAETTHAPSVAAFSEETPAKSTKAEPTPPPEAAPVPTDTLVTSDEATSDAATATPAPPTTDAAITDPALSDTTSAASPEQPPPPAAPGQLTLEVSPWADVTLDDRLLGRTPLGAPIDLPPGIHTLTLRHPRFPDYTTEVDIAAGDTQTLTVSLWNEVGQLSLEVSPWAHVHLNGALLDTTPLDHPLIVPPGTHRLSLENPSLGRWDTTLTVARGENKVLRLNLHRRLAQ